MVVRYAISVVDNPSGHASSTPHTKLAKINKSINMSLKMVVRSVISGYPRPQLGLDGVPCSPHSLLRHLFQYSFSSFEFGAQARDQIFEKIVVSVAMFSI
ncbi:hypothetical protein Y032_0090g2333 [Ancylostoma ceylanicum]|uniref:Uncharacterized protein n=1 Tax=Ancylostoma ceylanicum TaxID=53326 RepID=A0A016TMS2_9BILA|nr:hypothetical protein Y032_0090g2333 [Ancylostoma ceylanicum]